MSKEGEEGGRETVWGGQWMEPSTLCYNGYQNLDENNLIRENQCQQEGNVLQEPAAAMHLMFPLKSVSRKSMIPNQLLEVPLMQL